MANQQLAFAIRAVNEATAVLRDVQRDVNATAGATEQATSRMSRAWQGVGSAISGVTRIAAGFVVAQGVMRLPGAISDVVDRASDLQLQAQKVETVFAGSIGTVQEWAENNAHAMGLSTREAQVLAANMADLLKPMGFTAEQAADMSTETLGLAGALAEWSGGTKDAAEVAEILQKALLGERDGLKGLGISISEAEVQARLLEKGQGDLEGQALAMARAIATQELIFEKSGDAQAAFADGAGTAARRQAEMRAAMREAKDELALALAPALLRIQEVLAQAVIPALAAVVMWISTELAPAVQRFVEEYGPLVAQFWEEFVRPALSALIEIVRDDVIPALVIVGERVAEAWGAARDVAEPAIAFLAEHTDIVQAALIGLAAGITAVLIPAILAWAAAEVVKTAALIAGTAAFVAANAPIIALVAVIAILVAGIVLLVQHWDEITERVPWLGRAFDEVKAVAQRVADWFVADAMPAIGSAIRTVVDAAAAVIDWFRANWGTIRSIVEPVFDQIVLYVDTIRRTFQELIGFVVNVFQGDWAEAWSNIKAIFQTQWDLITGSLGNLDDLIRALWPLVRSAAAALGANIIAGLRAGIAGAGEMMQDIAATVGNAIRGFINQHVIDRINRALEFTIAVPFGPDIHINPPDIPHLAAGGIVTRPTLAVVGEAGPEAIVPLRQAPAMAPVINITVQAWDSRDVERAIPQLARRLDLHLRRMGRGGLTA